jgi:hypothetical protein
LRHAPGIQHRPCSRQVSVGQLPRPTTLAAAGQGRFEPLHRPLTVEVEEVLGHGTVHLQGEATVGGGAVELLGERAEVHVLHAQTVDGAHHLDERAAEPVKLPHHEHVLGSQVGERRLELGPLGPSLAGLLFLEDPLASGLGQRVTLKVEVLIERGDAGISDEHVGIVPRQRFPVTRLPDTFS